MANRGQYWERLKGLRLATHNIEIGPEDTRPVVILTDQPFPDELQEDKKGRILTEGRVTRYEEVTRYSILEMEDKPESLKVILMAPAMASNKDSAYLNTIKLLKRLKPSAIICAGFSPARMLFGPQYYQHYGHLRTHKFTVDDYDGKEHKLIVKAMVSVPVMGFTHPKPGFKGDEGGGGVNLIGQFVNHLRTAIRGFNKYEASIPPILDVSDLEYNEDPSLVLPKKNSRLNYKYVGTIKEWGKFNQILRSLTTKDIVCFDTETSNLSKLSNKLLTMQFIIKKYGKPPVMYFVPFAHKETPFTGTELNIIQRDMKRWFEFGKSRYIIMHNCKFDITRAYGELKVRWNNHSLWDTQASTYLLDENRKFLQQAGVQRPYALDTLEREYGFFRPKLAIEKADRGSMENAKLSDIIAYGMYDVVSPYLIHFIQKKQAKEQGIHNYDRLVTRLLGRTLDTLAKLEFTGMPVSRERLTELIQPESEVNAVLNKDIEKFNNFKSVRKVNNRLLKERGWEEGGGLFGSEEKPVVFDLSTDAHKQELFFKCLKLEPINRGKTGTPKLDATFKSVYKHIPEVELFSRIEKMKRLKSGFVDNLYERLLTEPDALKDGRIRATYSFIYILTSRLSSVSPNLQNQPSHGPLAKIIKSVWAIPKTTESNYKHVPVMIKSDYAAHEVRGAGNVSNDKTVKAIFNTADAAIRNLRLCKESDIEAAKDRVNKEGDIHVLNYKFFYNEVITKDDPRRQNIKAVVFGVLFGKTAPGLAAELGIEVEEAQELIDKLFETWAQVGDYIPWLQEEAQKNLVIFNPIGVPRHLPAYLHSSYGAISAMNRRGPNSIIQGFSSQIGNIAMYQINREAFKTFERKKLYINHAHTNTVHDSILDISRFEALPILAYLIEHGMTTLSMNALEDDFGFKTPIPFNNDMAMGFSEKDLIEWKDGRFNTQFEIIKSLASQRSDITKQALADCLHNAEMIAKVRTKELKSDPFNMLLQGKSEWYRKNMRGIHER